MGLEEPGSATGEQRADGCSGVPTPVNHCTSLSCETGKEQGQEETVGRSYGEINCTFLHGKDNLRSLEQSSRPASSLERGPGEGKRPSRKLSISQGGGRGV